MINNVGPSRLRPRDMEKCKDCGHVLIFHRSRGEKIGCAGFKLSGPQWCDCMKVRPK